MSRAGGLTLLLPSESGAAAETAANLGKPWARVRGGMRLRTIPEHPVQLWPAPARPDAGMKNGMTRSALSLKDHIGFSRLFSAVTA